MPELYILFEKSNSTVGRLGRRVMPYPYTHVTVSFDGETYYSFSRRRYHDPFDAGFTEEKLAYFAYEETEVKIYRLDISEEEKRKYKNNIEDIENALKAKGLQGDVVTLSPRTDEEYMRKVSITQQIRSFCQLFYKLYLKKE